MTGLLIAAAFALLTAAAVAFGARLGKAGWEPIAAAALVGVAGYAWQGRPALGGHPVAAQAAKAAAFDQRLADKRSAMGERIGPATQWMVLSDGLARQGNTQAAANVLVSALRSAPDDPNLWVGLGNALVAHQGGVLSPAAEHAYRQAMRLAPDAPSPRYFYALGLAQSGQLVPARAMWSALASQYGADTPFRAELERNLALLDRLIAQQGGAGPDAGQ